MCSDSDNAGISTLSIQAVRNNDNNNNSGFIWRTYPPIKMLKAPVLLLPPALAHSAFEGRNSCRVPIYYNWVKRDNCG